MSFWDIVIVPSAVQHPSFTGIPVPRSANASQAISTTDNAGKGSQIFDPPASVADNSTSDQLAALPPTAAEEDIEMVDAHLPAAESAPDVTAIYNGPRTSTFPNTDLSARLLKFVGWKEPSPGLSVHTPIYAEASPSHRTAYPTSNPQESDDLDELEAMMIPAPLRQAYRERVDISFDPRPQIVKTSKYTTALLTESGVTEIDNPDNEARITHGPFADDMSSVAPVNEFVGYDDLPGVLAWKAQSAQPIDKAEMNAAMNELAHDAETAYLDAKYFDLDSYLEHSRGAKGKKPSAMAKSATVPAGKPKGLPLRSKAQSTVEDSNAKGQAITPHTGAAASATTNRARKLPPKLPTIAENEGNDTLDENVSSPPKTPGGSDNETLRVKPKEKSPLSSRKWQPIEDSYMLLFHKKVLSVVERGHNIRAPGPTPIMEAFNNFFVGKIIDPSLPAYEPRGEPSIKGKLQISTGDIKTTRDKTRGLLEGKKGGLAYVPVITQEELELFMANGTVQIDDPNDATKNDAKSPKRKRELKETASVENKRVKQ